MRTYVDLTLPIETGHWRYPNVIEACATKAADGANVTYYELQSHWFTHIDAPRHHMDDGKTLDAFELSLLIGQASLLDVSDIQPNEGIGAQKLKNALTGCEHMEFLIVKTNWELQRSWKSKEYWSEAPYINAEGAEFLRSLQPQVVGFDFPQDYDIRRLHKVDLNEIDLTTHDVLLANDILMIEYLSNLWKVPVQNVDIYALPLNLKNADGAQIRVVASF